MTKLSLACGLALSAALATYSSVLLADTTAAAATAAAPAAATTAAPADTTAAAAAKKSKPKLVCEEADQMGSHFSQHICMTPEQMAQRRKDSQRAAQDLQQRAQAVSAEGKPPI